MTDHPRTTRPPSTHHTATTTRPSALDLLVPDRTTAAATVEHALTESGALDKTEHEDPTHVRAAKHMRKQIAEQITGVLMQFPMADMLIGGWSHLDKVGQARKETAADGTSRTISVGNHELTVRHDPQVELLVDRVPVTLLKLFFEAVFTIEASVLQIAAGSITQATPGPISVKAALTSNGIVVLQQTTPRIDPRGMWPGEFGGPYILGAAEPPAGPDKPAPTKSQLAL